MSIKIPPKASANRGKYAETKVREHLQFVSDRIAAFDFNRCLDAHAAAGRFPPQAGDFQAFLLQSYGVQIDNEWGIERSESAFDPHAKAELRPAGLSRKFQVSYGQPGPLPVPRNFLLEVKELKHDFRLPAKNYSADKVARVSKRVLAGSEALVLVYHTEIKSWRAVPFAVFQKPAPSWDLSPYPLVDYREALNQFFGVSP